MDKFVYLVTQLPALEFNGPAPWTTERFRDEAEKWLSERDRRVLEGARLDASSVPGDPEPEALRAYRAFDRRLRAALIAWRRRESEDGRLPDPPPGIPRDGNPLERETALWRLRWQRLEELETGHHFDLTILILYYLKLQIAERLGRFDAEAGMRHFHTLSEVAS